MKDFEKYPANWREEIGKLHSTQSYSILSVSRKLGKDHEIAIFNKFPNSKIPKFHGTEALKTVAPALLLSFTSFPGNTIAEG